MEAVVALVHRFVRSRDDGQDLMEYGLLVALIAVIAIVTVTAVGNTVNTVFWETFANVI
jgi:Flp pilus assembly pilin Flp